MSVGVTSEISRQLKETQVLKYSERGCNSEREVRCFQAGSVRQQARRQGIHLELEGN